MIIDYEPVQVYEGDGINRDITPYCKDKEFTTKNAFCNLCQIKQGKIEEFSPFLFDNVVGDQEGLRIVNGIIYFDKPYVASIQSQIEISTDTIGSEIFISLFDSINQVFVGNSVVHKFSTNSSNLSTIARVTGDTGTYSMGFHKREQLCSEFNISGVSFLRIDYMLREK